MSMTLTYTAIAARSTFRNTRFVIFTLALPLVMYLLFNGLYGQQQDAASGISVSAYLMVSMAAYGGLGAAINAGARVAIERQTGWNRQLRLSALSNHVRTWHQQVGGLAAGGTAGHHPGVPGRRD